LCIYCHLTLLALSFSNEWIIAWSPESGDLTSVMNNVMIKLSDATENVTFICKYNQGTKHNGCLSASLPYLQKVHDPLRGRRKFLLLF
jgi:hypothetical protein